MRRGLIAKTVQERYNKARSRMSTDALIDEILDLQEYKSSVGLELNRLMTELKSRGIEDLYLYYEKSVRRIQDEEAEFKQKKVTYLFNKVIELNDSQKLWKFICLLEDLKEDYGYKMDYKKCSMAIYKTDDIKLNLTWCELYDENLLNKEFIFQCDDLDAIIKLIHLGKNITEEDEEYVSEMVTKYANDKQYKEYNQVLLERYNKN